MSGRWRDGEDAHELKEKKERESVYFVNSERERKRPPRLVEEGKETATKQSAVTSHTAL